MSNPLRKCAGCSLRVEVLTALDDGRHYCRSCALIFGTTPEDAAPGDAVPDGEQPGAEESPVTPHAAAGSEHQPASSAPPAEPRRAAAEDLPGQVREMLDQRLELEARREELAADLTAVAEELELLNARVDRIQELLHSSAA